MIGACIVAPATPPGRSALAVVRLSGSGLERVRDAVLRPLRGGRWRPGCTRRVLLEDASGAYDDGLAVWSVGPRSYTGEDTLEVSLHGNPLLVERLVAACLAAGARLAAPGEFTRRAVLNRKLDLIAAEAVDLTIRATTPAGLQVAQQAERLGAELQQVRQRLVGVIAELEARLDYPADELALETDERLLEDLRHIGSRCQALAHSHEVGRALVEGVTIAIVGPVNVGKSSLFNALLGSERALVHEGAGTTRDVVESRVRMGPLEVRLLDTAGERHTDDPVEAAGLALAGRLIEQADLLLLVRRAGGNDPVFARIQQRVAERPHLVVSNKIDRGGEVVGLGVSAQTGAGLAALREAIVKQLGAQQPQDLLLGSARQAALCGQIASACSTAVEAFAVAGVAVAIDILVGDALTALDQLTGADSREDVLDALFQRFCIGK